MCVNLSRIRIGSLPIVSVVAVAGISTAAAAAAVVASSVPAPFVVRFAVFNKAAIKHRINESGFVCT